MQVTRRIMIDRDKCMACRTCAISCITEHNLDGRSIYDINLEDKNNTSRNHMELTKDGQPAPIICRHCSEPECVYTCMSGAMSKDYETSHVTHDKDQCASCLMCVMACPFGVLKVNLADNSILKCDMCEASRGKDGIPACVENCPTGAIRLEEIVI